MDQIKVKSFNAADVADELLNGEISATRQLASELHSLDEWEMALAGGGETVVCW